MQNLLSGEMANAVKLVAASEPGMPDADEMAALRHDLETLKSRMATAPPALVSLKEVCRITSLSRTAINQRRKDGTFPAAVSLGDKRVAFVRSEVDSWIRARIGSRQKVAA